MNQTSRKHDLEERTARFDEPVVKLHHFFIENLLSRFAGSGEARKIGNWKLKIGIIALLFFIWCDYASAFTITTPTKNKVGLVGHWTFDGKDMITGTVRDVSGNNNHGSMVNMATATARVAGKIGQALKFDNTNDSMSLGDSPALPTGYPITVTAWVKANTLAQCDSVLQYGDSSNGRNWHIELCDGHVEWGGNSGSAQTTGSIIAGRWYFIAVSNSAVNSRVFYVIDSMGGFGVGESNTDSLSVTSPASYGARIGAFKYGGSLTDYFDGLIDDVRVYNRALSASEIQALYKMGEGTKVSTTPTPPTSSGCTTGITCGLVGHWTFDGPDMVPNVRDKSGQGNHGYMAGFTSTSTAVVAGKLGQALKFDGTNDFVGGAGGGGVTPPTFDTTNLTVTTSNNLSSGSVSHTVPDGTELLVIMVQGYPSGGEAFSWSLGGGQALAQISLPSYWGSIQQVLYYRLNPAAGAGTVSWTGGSMLGDGGVFHVFNLSGVDTTVGTNGIRGFTNDEADTLTTITLSPTTALGDLIISQWSQQLSENTTGQTYGGTSGTQNVRNGTGFNVDAAFLTTSIPTASGQTVTFLGRTGSNYPSGVSFSVAGEAATGGLNVGSVKTVSFWAKPSSLTQSIIDMDGTKNIDISSGTVRGNNVTGATIYVDGVQTTTFSNTNWHHVVMVTDTTINASAFTVGKISTNYFNGSLDDVRIYNRALSASEILALYKLGEGTKVASTPKPPTSSGCTTGITCGLVGHWTFDGKDMTTGTVLDVSGNNNHGSMVNMATATARVAGKLGQGLRFDGSNDYVRIADNSSLDLTSALTISAWIYKIVPAPDGDYDQFVVVKAPDGNPYPSQNNYAMSIVNPSGGGDTEHLGFFVKTSGGSPAYIRSNGSISLKKWHHIVVNYNDAANSSDMYIDGVLQSDTIFWSSDPASVSLFANDGDLYISSDAYDFNGLIDDVRIYSRALSAQEIQQLYNMGR